MIARVVPALKLPASLQYFDYLVPPGMALSPGDFVRVPFRSRPTLGVVFDVRDAPESSRFIVKPVLDVIPQVRLNHALLDVLRETSAAIKSNLPFLVHALVPEMPKRPNPPPQSSPFSRGRKPKAFLPVQSRGRVGVGVSLETYTTPSDRLNIYLDVLKTAHGQSLVIAPETADVAWLEEALRRKTKKRLVTLTGDLSKTKAWGSYTAFARGDADVLIGTRLACLTPAPRLTHLFLDRDEDPSHLQSDMHPHYDARDVLDLRARLEGVPLTITTETPRVERAVILRPKAEGSPEILRGACPEPCRRAQDDKKISATISSLHSYWRSGQSGFLTDDLITAITRARDDNLQVVLFLNRKGYTNLVTCKDCGKVIEAGRGEKDIPLFCPHCQSPELSLKKPGITRIAADVKKVFPDARVAVVERIREGQPPLPYPDADIIVCTEVFLHWYRTTAFDKPIGCVAAIFADPLWHKPDFRANEQALAVLRSFQNIAAVRHADFIVQTADLDARVIRALAGDLETFYTDELDDRKALGYPPFKAFPPPAKQREV